MRALAIVQARTSSARLPGKVLLPLGDRTILARVLQRVQRSQLVGAVRVATTDRPDDDPVVEVAKSEGVSVTRGPEQDVLRRYQLAVEESEAEIVVRITADCPLLAPELIDRAISTLSAGEFDYVSNTVQREFPRGLDVEVLRRAALERANREAHALGEREHVTPYVWRNPQLFRVGSLLAEPEERAPEFRVTVDEPADYGMICGIVQLLPPGDFSAKTLCRVLREHSWLAEINSGVRQKPAFRGTAAERTLRSYLHAARQCLREDLLEPARALVRETRRLASELETPSEVLAELRELEASVSQVE